MTQRLKNLLVPAAAANFVFKKMYFSVSMTCDEGDGELLLKTAQIFREVGACCMSRWNQVETLENDG
jgi:hypothetical protein